MNDRPALVARLTAPLLCFVGSFAALAVMLLGFPVLYDTDAYLHLAIARLYAAEGFVDALPWARASILGSQYGDKELLFHVLLMPFVPLGSVGGRLVLAGLGATIATVVGLFARRAIGRWGWWIPAFLFVGSAPFLSRAIRLRPELLSLLLLLIAVGLAGARRWRWVGLVAFVYSLSYTAVHALLGLMVLLVAQAAWRDRRVEWAGLLYPLLGAAVGLLIHPQFPDNLLIWKIQSIDFFRWKDVLDVGREIRPPRGDELLWGNAPFVLALLALWRAAEWPRRPDAPPVERADIDLADAMLVAGVAFSGLALLGLRFVTYGAPFAALAIVWWIARSGRRIGPSIRLPWRGRVSTVAALSLLLVLGAGRTAFTVWSASQGPRGESPDPLEDQAVTATSEREREWSQFGQAVPVGAKVAAEWGSAGLYAFWAPQGRYLNVFDPVFMAWLDPAIYAAQKSVFDGTEPDLAMTLRETLDSDYIALSRFHRFPVLQDRLNRDPRIVPIYNRWTQLWRVGPSPEVPSVMDGWLIRTLDGERHPYPRVDDPRLREIEAFVDGRRLPQDWLYRGCLTAVREEKRSERHHAFWELAATGRTRVVVDGVPVFATENQSANLGAGYLFVVDLEPGPHKWVIRSCPGPGGFPAFSLRERRPIGKVDPAGLPGVVAEGREIPQMPRIPVAEPGEGVPPLLRR